MNLESIVAFNVTEQTPPIRFLASLSDGTTVIEDERPGVEHAWFRLKKYIEANNLKITCLRLQAVFPDVLGSRMFEATTASNQLGYVYGKRVAVNDSGGQGHQLGIGHFDGNTALVQWFFVPMMVGPFPERQDKKACGFKLIENPA